MYSYGICNNLYLQASADAALSSKPVWPVTRGGRGFSRLFNVAFSAFCRIYVFNQGITYVDYKDFAPISRKTISFFFCFFEFFMTAKMYALLKCQFCDCLDCLMNADNSYFKIT